MGVHNRSSKTKRYKVGWPSISGMCGAPVRCVVTGVTILPISMGNMNYAPSMKNYFPCVYEFSNGDDNGELLFPCQEHIALEIERTNRLPEIDREYLDYFRKTQPDLVNRKWSDMFLEV